MGWHIMGEATLEPRLHEELERLANEGRLDEPVAVIIKNVGDVDAQLGEGGAIQELEARVRQVQQRVRARLGELGVANVRQITLSNALETVLTPSQIREIAQHDDVEEILFDREDQVTS